MLIVLTMIGLAGVMPVVSGVIGGADVSGSTETILQLIPLFIALMLLIVYAKPILNRIQ